MVKDEDAGAPEGALLRTPVWRRGEPATRLDRVAGEAPLTVQAAGRPWITLMRTPGQERELIAGLLRAEAIVQAASELLSVQVCTQLDDPEHEGHVYRVRLSPEAASRLAQRRRSTLSVSSCGVCGKEQIEASLTQFPERPAAAAPVKPEWVASLSAEMRKAQRLFEETGAVHAAGVFEPGALAPKIVCEDVGRHNAVDKALGHCFVSSSEGAQGSWLVVSGRVSFEIVQKAAMHGCAGIVAVSAPTSLAVQLAQHAGLVLVGFARGEDFVCYAGAAQIEGGCTK